MSKIKLLRGEYEIKYFPKKASTAMTAGTFAAWSASGLMTFATATSTEIIGLLMRTITSADADYATSNVLIPVMVFDEDTVLIATEEAHGVTEAMNGEFVDITDADTINGAANVLEVIKVEKYIDANTVEFSFARKSGVTASTNAD
jgi:glutathionyl-hydroquinone reductase